MIARMQKAMKEKDGGFTLVELIVVVVIIGVLAAIAVPVFLNQTAKAKEKADLANLSNAKVAVASYLADNTPASSATSIATADLQPYGFPTAPAMTVAYTAPSGSTAADFVITLTTSQSGKTCKVLSAQANPTCT